MGYVSNRGSSCGGFVERKFFLSWSRCPIAVWMDFGRYFVMACSVRPGQELKNPNLTAFIHVDGTGLNAAACRNFINSLIGCNFVITFASGCGDGGFLCTGIGTNHMPFVSSLSPVRIVDPFLEIVNLDFVNVAVQLSSHN